MKNRYLIVASSILISMSSFAQKDQLKAAEKALKNGNAAEAKATLQGAESLIAAASDAEKAQFYFLKGNAYLDLAKKNVETAKSYAEAAKAYQLLIDAEKASGKAKYSKQAEGSLVEVKNGLINGAIADNAAKNYKEGALKLYQAYNISKKDTINLYYAASGAINGKDYDLALKYYEELKQLNFSGKGTNYYAVSKVNDKEDSFANEKDMRTAVKIGTHEKPRMEKEPSKRGEIYKNMALILVQKGDIDAAKKSIADARKMNPEDNSLLMTEANLYLQTKDYDTYKKLVTEALAKNPNDADLYYNLGVISSEAKDPVEAEKYFKKAIEINPKYSNAYLNIASLKLGADGKITEEMNKLGTSPKDNKRYEVLKKERETLHKSLLPLLEKAVELDPSNQPAIETLLSIYGALDMTDKYNALKATLK
ncbi:tetratricopeptide repeat protein [Flavobacterium sp. '19STA2R22 D10 B1']|uniref:tetratricopeptide repeat protein n=1 Tax=Flavobacterium aerium TaxID=3037261 RepID=UPI00278BF870|nr:tetratricopeptide repeat protein [Flavobacterium sp. '19STA2R22 D10 B1']